MKLGRTAKIIALILLLVFCGALAVDCQVGCIGDCDNRPCCENYTHAAICGVLSTGYQPSQPLTHYDELYTITLFAFDHVFHPP